MRTLLINRFIGHYRLVPATAPRGSAQLPARLVERARAAGLIPRPPTLLAVPSKPPHVAVEGLARCRMHGIVSGSGCPSGCSRAFQDPVFADDPDLPPVQKRGGEYRLVPKGHAPDDGAGYLAMTEGEVRAIAKRVLSHCPAGSKKPLARACGYRGKWALHSLRGVAKGRAMLPDAVRRRLSVVLRQVMRGELVPVTTGQLHTTGRPSMTWARVDAATARHSRVPFKP